MIDDDGLPPSTEEKCRLRNGSFGTSYVQFLQCEEGRQGGSHEGHLTTLVLQRGGLQAM
jgi:hypothetical protein